MMAAVALTIGAIAGLSNTSVSNTLVELILGYIAGSAGLYFISSKVLKEPHILSLIGYVGVVFLVAFWVAYIPTSLYRSGGSTGYAWHDDATTDVNLAAAEIIGHARSLGIEIASLRPTLDALVGAPSSSCGLARNDAREWAPLLGDVFEHVAQCTPPGSTTSAAATYLSSAFRAARVDLRSDDVTFIARGQANYATGVSTLLDIARLDESIRSPTIVVGPACEALGADPTVRATAIGNATLIEGVITDCGNAPLTDFLLNARAHARAYEAIWEAPAGTDIEARAGTLEMREVNAR